MSETNLLLCYNRGCGQSYDPSRNNDDACRHHSGPPVFHDAYKGWSCCNKKCTDFTEFLNIKGCTVTKHSNVKPPEPEKPEVNEHIDDDIIEYKAPISAKPQPLERPPFDTPMGKIKPTANTALRDQLALIKTSGNINPVADEISSSKDIRVGTSCQNNSCKTTYEGPETLYTNCTYHPGFPVFHEGMKFWTCCMKRTTDFENFLVQVGCSSGEHVWFKRKQAGGDVKCRLDWYQTASHVYISIFGKKCDPDASTIELSPVRLKWSLFFPEQNGTYSKDIELHGIVDVPNCSVSMTPAKVEVCLKKLEVGSWAVLHIPREAEQQEVAKTKSSENVSSLSEQVESVDLGDL